MRAIGTLLAMVLVVTLAGCQPGVRYAVTPVSREALNEKLDAEWFVRDVSDEQGLKYVELVYCPVQPGEGVPVCRTSIVWTRGQSQLLQ